MGSGDGDVNDADGREMSQWNLLRGNGGEALLVESTKQGDRKTPPVAPLNRMREECYVGGTFPGQWSGAHRPGKPPEVWT